MGHRPGRVLVTQEEIAGRVRELGQALSRDYAGKDPLLVGVLKGAVVFLADLMRAVDIPLAADFIAVSSYGGNTRTSGVVKITADLSISIEERHVVIVEDIIDSGRTISYLKRNLETRHPASLRVMALLDKVERREVDVELDYVGFTIPNEFVVGYGLDYHGLYRNLPCIAALEENPPR
ncbi:MAG: hypoxanthine phosphoribosyltransferase [Candidatus Rokubacteria bacterium RIFCSPLOWO2_02_FULL_68_19]|nr:MAG: hypoxanthine phosphoribosyltransferase [Candidatus Rokubacteria bacterium RIFCSPLOWO2_02_FULL_68_19]